MSLVKRLWNYCRLLYPKQNYLIVIGEEKLRKIQNKVITLWMFNTACTIGFFLLIGKATTDDTFGHVIYGVLSSFVGNIMYSKLEEIKSLLIDPSEMREWEKVCKELSISLFIFLFSALIILLLFLSGNRSLFKIVITFSIAIVPFIMMIKVTNAIDRINNMEMNIRLRK